MTEIGVAVGTGALLLGGSIVSTYLSHHMTRDDSGFYIGKKYVFGEEYTSIIDDMLMKNPNVIINSELIELGRHLPGVGNHYFYYDHESIVRWFFRICFTKKKEVIVDRIIYNYICWVGVFGDKTFDKALTFINSIDINTLRTISIDTAPMIPRILYGKKLCHESKRHQTTVLDHIISHFTEDNNYNTKLIISGERGTGKTYIGRLLKKRLDDLKYTSLLFDDFNPSSVGVNIQELILNKASISTPVIIIIDEIDKAYDQVTTEETVYDNRLQYTRNKQSFNNMLDVISDTKYVIAIYTTEKSIDQLNENVEHRSFFRHGRVDFFVNMTSTESTITNN
jgi:hypothetical protein